MARKIRISRADTINPARKHGRVVIDQYIHERIIQQRINRLAMRRTKAIHQ